MHRRTVALAFLAGLVALSGCAGITDSSPTDTTTDVDVSADAVQADTLAAMAAVTSYEFSADLQQDLGTLTTDISLTGVVNLTAERMSQKTTVTATRGDRSNAATTETYVVDDTAYIRSQGVWQTRPVPERTWNNTPVDRQAQFLTDAAVTVLNKTTVAGVETYALAVEPDPATVEAYIENRRSVRGDVTVESVSVTQYVAVDTHRIRTATLDMTATINGQTLDQTLTITFSEYGADTDITVPEAATT
ncbi:hypothetical protein [Salarchaeum sp. JOR-1]|uniref:hypothetical protein n=1 Tax=Salarchaeum sp. JOR-1 TaxID=2599399 RepID=UPI0011987EBA|nr:hypothetical protein [Salarchaeum sp. JOR-1]QDX40039.1 hypothetical protein FQU85_03680 [Salarchaeum sp. JOR-1]